MAKQKLDGQSDELVMLSMGWYGKFAMPVDAATAIVQQIIKSGAVKLESDHLDVIGSVLRPAKMDFDLQPLDGKYLADCPTEDAARSEYYAWLKTKASVIGKGYEPESYTQYLKAKE